MANCCLVCSPCWAPFGPAKPRLVPSRLAPSRLVSPGSHWLGRPIVGEARAARWPQVGSHSAAANGARGPHEATSGPLAGDTARLRARVGRWARGRRWWRRPSRPPLWGELAVGAVRAELAARTAQRRVRAPPSGGNGAPPPPEVECRPAGEQVGSFGLPGGGLCVADALKAPLGASCSRRRSLSLRLTNFVFLFYSIYFISFYSVAPYQRNKISPQLAPAAS